MIVDIRNKFNVNLPRAKGAFLEDAPEYIWDEDSDWVLEPKMCGDRLSLQIGSEKSLMRGRNRQDFMKGVAKAGAFRDISNMNPKLVRVKSRALDGSLLDGELTEMYNSVGEWTETTKVIHGNGNFVGYTVWTVLFVKWKDVRSFSEKLRRDLTSEIVKELNDPKIRLIERVPATKENLQLFFKREEEGAIAKKLSVGIDPESRTNPFWWKLKSDDKRTVDAYVIGVQQSASGGSGITGEKRKPNGEAATFTIAMLNKDGKQIEVGKMSNLPENAEKFGWTNLEGFRNRVAEVRVSGWDGKRFRYPRFVRWRPDKFPSNCLLEEQVGKKEDRE